MTATPLYSDRGHFSLLVSNVGARAIFHPRYAVLSCSITTRLS